MKGFITIAAILTIILSVSTVAVRADDLLYEVAGTLTMCGILFCGVPTEYGVSATIQQSASTPTSGQAIAFWVSLDWYQPFGSEHEWLQTGIAYGEAPNGIFYNGPEYYLEYQTGSAYQFTPLGSADTKSHTFLVSDTPGVTDPTATVMIDGKIDLSMSWAISGSVSGGAEVHLPPGQAMPTLSATWSSLQFLDGSNNWRPFDYATLFDTFSYGIVETCGGPTMSPNSGTSFSASTNPLVFCSYGPDQCGGCNKWGPHMLMAGVGTPKIPLRLRTESPVFWLVVSIGVGLVPLQFLARRYWKRRESAKSATHYTQRNQSTSSAFSTTVNIGTSSSISRALLPQTVSIRVNRSLSANCIIDASVFPAVLVAVT